MSRIGKQPINIPQGVNVSFDEKTGVFSVIGPLGSLDRKMRSEVKVSIAENSIVLDPIDKDIFSKALWGTYASHIINMIEGVSKGFEKTMIIEGVGYKAEVSGNELILKVGYSHSVNMEIPEGLEILVEKNKVKIKGFDKELVGSFSGRMRKVRKPEPYKGKGIRYEDEIVQRKQGKRAA